MKPRVPVNVLLARLSRSPRWLRAGENLRLVLSMIVLGVYHSRS